MTPENIVGVVFIGILVLAFVGVALKERVQQKHVFLNKLRREWGNAPSGEWTVEELESISHYTRRREKGRFKVDDITWNDLDLDSVFLQMNSTVSSCGEDYLYSLLRLPESVRFNKGLYGWVGFSRVLVPYTRPARAAGTGK